MSTVLLESANANLVACTDKLAALSETGGTRRFGSVVDSAGDVPVPIFNRVFVFDPPDPDDLAEAVEWIAGRGRPFWVTATAATADDVAALAPELGLADTGTTQPGMVLSSLESIPERSAVVDVETVRDREGLATFSAVAGAVFEIPEAVRHDVTPPAVLEDPEVVLLLGRVDAEPVATGLLARTGDVAGVYTIAVAESHRRRGIGEAMTWATLRAGRDAGCRVAVLQSSEMGYPVYERMGFETVVTYRHFAPAGGEARA